MAGRGWDRRVLPVCAGAALAGALVLEVLVVLLRLGPRGEPFPFWPLAWLLFLLGSALENARRFIMASPSTRGVMLAGAGQGWDYCYSCQTHVPPRCSHCFTCNVCVLRRDHHCMLLGQCLGYQNYRYFICLLLYGSVVLLYGSLLNANVVLTLLEESGLAHTILLLVLPWLMLLIGQVNIAAFVHAFVTDVCIVGFLFCTSFLLFHGLLALRGQTTKEWFEGNRQYDLGWRNNLRQVMGDRWILAFLTPFIASPLPGDGITFQTRSPQNGAALQTPQLLKVSPSSFLEKSWVPFKETDGSLRSKADDVGENSEGFALPSLKAVCSWNAGDGLLPPTEGACSAFVAVIWKEGKSECGAKEVDTPAWLNLSKCDG